MRHSTRAALTEGKVTVATTPTPSVTMESIDGLAMALDELVSMGRGLTRIDAITSSIESLTKNDIALITEATNTTLARSNQTVENIYPGLNRYLGKRVSNEGIGDALKAIWTAFVNLLKRIWEGIKSFFGASSDKAASEVNKAEKAVDYIQSAEKKIEEAKATHAVEVVNNDTPEINSEVKKRQSEAKASNKEAKAAKKKKIVVPKNIYVSLGNLACANPDKIPNNIKEYIEGFEYTLKASRLAGCDYLDGVNKLANQLSKAMESVSADSTKDSISEEIKKILGTNDLTKVVDSLKTREIFADSGRDSNTHGFCFDGNISIVKSAPGGLIKSAIDIGNAKGLQIVPSNNPNHSRFTDEVRNKDKGILAPTHQDIQALVKVMADLEDANVRIKSYCSDIEAAQAKAVEHISKLLSVTPNIPKRFIGEVKLTISIVFVKWGYRYGAQLSAEIVKMIANGNRVVEITKDHYDRIASHL